MWWVGGKLGRHPSRTGRGQRRRWQAQRVLGLEDFIANNDEAELVFKLARRLVELEAGAARQRAALDARTDSALVREYKKWLAEKATRRIKKEIFDLDDE
jgi:hypothetical protein